ncbi:MAG TPA: DNA-binding transcriptional regulator [Gemmataceae bacterium]|nr:DNA-binding transcriptional regulator [Gemmataceae bacterium]
MNKRPRIAVLVESTRAYGRGLLAGIASYVRQQDPWTLYWQERSLRDPPPRWLRGWDGDGVIARIATPQLARALRALRLPTVDLYGWLPNGKWPCVRTDNVHVARLAAKHLLERGFRHVAYCGFKGVNYSEERLPPFRQCITEAGQTCHVYRYPRFPTSAGLAAREQQGVLYRNDLAYWLRELPKPAGILACNDICGQQLLNACREIGLPVPDQVAVLGVDNDDVLCNLSDPPLSSVDLNCTRIGFEAASLLARLLRGRAAPRRTILLEPRGIVARRSTDVLAIEDAEVVAAIRLIRAQACAGLTVAELLKSCSLSASSLNRRFTYFLGRTPKAEIIRVRLQRVVELLAEPDLSLAVIAARSGFNYLEYMSAAFKKKFGMSPGQYRRRVLHARGRQEPS